MNFVGTSKTLKDIANSQLVSLALDNYKNRMAFHHSQGSMAMRCMGKDDRHHQKLLEEESWEVVCNALRFGNYNCLNCSEINHKPLTYLSQDINDLQPITPLQLIICCRIKEFPYPINIEDIHNPSFNERTIISKCLTRNQLLLQMLAFGLADFIS